jgi:hypothetical protein
VAARALRVWIQVLRLTPFAFYALREDRGPLDLELLRERESGKCTRGLRAGRSHLSPWRGEMNPAEAVAERIGAVIAVGFG